MPDDAETVFKQVAHPETTKFDFVMSEASVDRYGDVVESDGWELTNFKRHPIALFNHNIDAPIGLWKDVRVERGRLRGRLVIAEGAAPEIDKLAKLVDMGVLGAVSVGFKPLEREPIKEGKGVRYKRHELLECSLVTVPANANALQVARSLKLSDAMISRVFGVDAATAPGATARGPTGVHAETSRSGKGPAMEPIAKQIESAQERVDALQDQLARHIEATGTEPDDAALDRQDELNKQVGTARRRLSTLQDSERQMGVEAVQRAQERLLEAPIPAVVPRVHHGEIIPPGQSLPAQRRPFAVPAGKQPTPEDHALRALLGVFCAHASRGRKTPEQVIAERYGEDGHYDPRTRLALDLATRQAHQESFDIVTRTARDPALTSVPAWAGVLAQTSIQGFADLLLPASVLPGLMARAIRMNFGRNGIISVPRRDATPTVAGGFVLEGNAIPVKQAAFSTVPFVPKKVAVITTYSREMAEHSTPSLETLLRNAIQEDTSVVVDGVLLSNTAASSAAPAGIRNGVTVTTATAGGGFAALVGDITALLTVVQTGSNGQLRRLVWLMNPVNATRATMTQNAGGDFPFKAEVNTGTLQGYPLIVSSTVPVGMVILMDAADFVVLEGGAPRFDFSDQATLHMDDAATALSSGAGPTPVAVANIAAPTRSLFQTDTIALRMIWDLNWGFIRTGTLAWTQTVSW